MSGKFYSMPALFSFVARYTTVLLVSASILLVFLYFGYSYHTVARSISKQLSMEAGYVEQSFAVTMSNTEFIMKLLNAQIAEDHKNPSHIHDILSKYRVAPHVENELAWTIFSWADDRHMITVDAVYGVMEKPFDLSVRDYIPKTGLKPNKIHIGAPVFGSTSDRWMLPAGVGALNDEGEYVGAMTIGFDIALFTKKLQQSLSYSFVRFAIIDQNFKPVISSFAEHAGDFEVDSKDAVIDSHVLYALETLKVEGNSTYSHVHSFGENFYIQAFSDYPYFVYIAFDSPILVSMFWHQFMERSAAVVTIIVFMCLVSFLLYHQRGTLQQNIIDQSNKLNQQKVQLEDALAARDRFITNMGHEIRTPIHQYKNFVSLAQTALKKVNDLAKFDDFVYRKEFNIIAHMLEKAASSGRKLMRLFGNIYDLNRMADAKVAYHIEQSNIHVLLCESIEMHESLKQRLSIDMPKGFDAQCMMDKSKMMLVFEHLFANMEDYAPEGKVVIALKKTSFKHKGKLHNGIKLSFSDQGPGIPQDELELVFEVFAESSTTRTEAGGRGIGLAVCKEIMLAHEGMIWAENNQKKGVTFHVVLPLT